MQPALRVWDYQGGKKSSSLLPARSLRKLSFPSARLSMTTCCNYVHQRLLRTIATTYSLTAGVERERLAVSVELVRGSAMERISCTVSVVFFLSSYVALPSSAPGRSRVKIFEVWQSSNLPVHTARALHEQYTESRQIRVRPSRKSCEKHAKPTANMMCLRNMEKFPDQHSCHRAHLVASRVTPNIGGRIR